MFVFKFSYVYTKKEQNKQGQNKCKTKYLSMMIPNTRNNFNSLLKVTSLAT